MKFSGKMYLMMILKVTKNQGFTLSLEDTFFEKPQEGRAKLSPLPPLPPTFPAVLGLTNYVFQGLGAYEPVAYKEKKCILTIY